MRRLLTMLFTIASIHACAQDPMYNTAAFWSRLQLDNSDVQPEFGNTDTTIIIASNRVFDKDSLRFMSQVADEHMVRYFFVYTNGGKWHFKQTNSLRAAINYLPKTDKDWVVYTEGMGKILTTDADRTMRMAATYKLNVLMLDYPSIHSDWGALKNYKFAIHNARVAYKDLVPVIDSMKELKTTGKLGTGRMTLFFHSMGNNVMKQTALHDYLAYLNDKVWVDNLVLNAPCVKQRKHRRWVDKIHFAKHIYINYNPNDGTLKWAQYAAFKKQLGRNVKHPISKNATYINFSAIAGVNHSNFIELPMHPPINDRMVSQYSLLFHGDTLHVHDAHLYAPSKYKKIGWEMLPGH